MAVTTAVWSSYRGKEAPDSPEMPYTYTFGTTTAFAGFALLLVPFIRIDTQGGGAESEASSHYTLDPSSGDLKAKIGRTGNGDDLNNRPSKRWSLADTVPQAPSWVHSSGNNNMGNNSNNNGGSVNGNAQGSVNTKTGGNSNDKSWRRNPPSTDAFRPSSRCRSSSVGATIRGEKPIVWAACGDCGTKKASLGSIGGAGANASHHPHCGAGLGVGGDPVRYFNDLACGGPVGEVCGSGGGGSRSSGSSSTKTAATVPSRPGPYPGRRRLPLVNREAMTYQMLTQGYQP